MSAAPLEVVETDALTLLERERRETERLRDALEDAERQARRYARALSRVVSMGTTMREELEDVPLIRRETADGGLSLLVGIARQAL